MTDRFGGFVVTLAKDIREDDAEATIAAIRMVKGVLDVKPILGGDSSAMVAEMRTKSAVRDKLYAMAKDL